MPAKVKRSNHSNGRLNHPPREIGVGYEKESTIFSFTVAQNDKIWQLVRE